MKSIVIASGKGGTGKTSCTAGIGCALAELGYRCLLIDADTGMQSLDMALGVHNYTAFNFGDVAKGIISLEDAAAKVEDFPNASVLSAPQDFDDLDEDTLRTIVHIIRDSGKYEFVLIDAPAGVGNGFKMAANAADMAIIAATSDPICLRSAEKTAMILKKLGVADQRLLVNRVRPVFIKRGMPDIDDAIDAIGAQLIGYVPEDSKVIMSGAKGIPVVKARRSRAAEAFRNISRRLTGEQVPLLKESRK